MRDFFLTLTGCSPSHTGALRGVESTARMQCRAPSSAAVLLLLASLLALPSRAVPDAHFGGWRVQGHCKWINRF